MASIQARTSRGKKYWSIVESRRVNGKPRTFILEYLGTPTTLLKRLQKKEELSLKSYSHGDSSALLQVAKELDVIKIINQHIPKNKQGAVQIREGINVGSSLLLAAIGRACHPTSKMAWYDWCSKTSLEYCLKSSFKKLDSQHFWDQMDAVPVETISAIEEKLIAKMVSQYKIEPDCLFFDTTNFFTFIDSTNDNCNLPKRGKNKQKRFDLRQLGMALLVTRKELFPLFHSVYEGNKADSNVFKDELTNMLKRLKKIFTEVSDITLVFDKGNNSKNNFLSLGREKCFYVASLIPVHFKGLLQKANKHSSSMETKNKDLLTYRIKTEIWGQQRTCIVITSPQLKEGQIRGIYQHLEKKYKTLNDLKEKLERPKPRVKLSSDDLKIKLKQIIKGQFIEDVLKFEIIHLNNNFCSFNYYIDNNAFDLLKKELLGKQIIISNRHEWSDEEIIKTYRGQSKVEYAFRTLKNPYHLAIRPQYHWTDQKIRVHFFICIIAYMLTIVVYNKACNKANYRNNIQKLMDDLSSIRLACIAKKRGTKVNFQLEKIPPKLKGVCDVLRISDDNIRSKLSSQLSVTTP